MASSASRTASGISAAGSKADAERAAALANLDALPSTDGWEINVTQLPPIDVCRQKVSAFATRNAILFQSGSAKMTEASAPALDELAGYLSRARRRPCTWRGTPTPMVRMTSTSSCRWPAPRLWSMR